MNKNIYIDTWLELKPYNNPTITDSYYLSICNGVKKAILSNKRSLALQKYLDDDDLSILCCFLTSYFEDLISETNIWNTFVKIHQRLYSKPLPFFKADDYFEAEINTHDLCFLIWYFLNTVQKDVFILPNQEFITETANTIIALLDKEWEYAPENNYLKSFYQIDDKESDYYTARTLIDRVLFKTYLFYPDTGLKLKEKELKIIKEHKDADHLTMFLNDNRDKILHSNHTRLLALTGKEWVSEILGSNHPLSKDIVQISKKIEGLFLYKGQDRNNVFIEHITSGKKFNLTKKSFDHGHLLNEIDLILFMGIVMWKGEWWFSGVFFPQPFNADTILDEKNSMESRMSVSFLDHEKQKTAEVLSLQLDAFKAYNNGSQIAFLPADKIDDFIKNYIDFYKKRLKFSEDEIADAQQRARSEGLFDTNKSDMNLYNDSASGLVFFNPNSGIEIGLNINSAFPVPTNPFYKEEESHEDVLDLLMQENFSKELTMYCIDNCKSNLPFFTKGMDNRFLDDFDFLLRFWKTQNYHSVPSITFIGQIDE